MAQENLEIGRFHHNESHRLVKGIHVPGQNVHGSRLGTREEDASKSVAQAEPRFYYSSLDSVFQMVARKLLLRVLYAFAMLCQIW